MPRGQPEHISDVLSQLLARRGYARERSASAFGEAWQSAVGEPWSADTRATVVRGGVLEVLVKNSTLVQELSFRKRELIDELGHLLPDQDIRDVKFRVGRWK